MLLVRFHYITIQLRLWHYLVCRLLRCRWLTYIIVLAAFALMPRSWRQSAFTKCVRVRRRNRYPLLNHLFVLDSRLRLVVAWLIWGDQRRALLMSQKRKHALSSQTLRQLCLARGACSTWWHPQVEMIVLFLIRVYVVEAHEGLLHSRPLWFPVKVLRLSNGRNSLEPLCNLHIDKANVKLRDFDHLSTWVPREYRLNRLLWLWRTVISRRSANTNFRLLQRHCAAHPGLR